MNLISRKEIFFKIAITFEITFSVLFISQTNCKCITNLAFHISYLNTRTTGKGTKKGDKTKKIQ